MVFAVIVVTFIHMLLKCPDHDMYDVTNNLMPEAFTHDDTL
jgi:hypothetical protein